MFSDSDDDAGGLIDTEAVEAKHELNTTISSVIGSGGESITLSDSSCVKSLENSYESDISGGNKDSKKSKGAKRKSNESDKDSSAVTKSPGKDSQKGFGKEGEAEALYCCAKDPRKC